MSLVMCYRLLSNGFLLINSLIKYINGLCLCMKSKQLIFESKGHERAQFNRKFISLGNDTATVSSTIFSLKLHKLQFKTTSSMRKILGSA